MSITPEVNAKTLTEMVAKRIRVTMVEQDVRNQAELSRRIGKNEQWVSVRLRGLQPIDLNDLALIAKGLNVGVHDLLPSPEETATASVSVWNPHMAERSPITRTPSHHRPSGREDSRRPGTIRRTARLPRPDLPGQD
jgi:transcriptional regulator with XRE-family HTH domain